MSGVKLYRHFAGDGTLLYVGISAKTGRRQHFHLQKSAWSDQIARIEIETFQNKKKAEDAEYEAIQNERPLYNIVHKRLGRFTGRSIMVSVRLPEGLLRAIDRAAFEDNKNRTEVINSMLDYCTELRQKT